MDDQKDISTSSKDDLDKIITEKTVTETEYKSEISLTKILVIVGLIIVFIIIFGLNFGLGVFVGPKIIELLNKKNGDSLTLIDPSETSEFGLNYEISVANGISKDEVSFRIISQFEKDFPDKIGENYQKYMINNISCSPNLKRNDQTCYINSSIKFKKKIGHEKTNLTDLGNNYVEKILNYLRQDPLKNVKIITDSSNLTNKKKSDLLTISKTSGNIEYGFICTSDEECDTNMTCNFDINESISRCKCIKEYIPIVSLKTGYFECVKAKQNYFDLCNFDNECQTNSFCYKNKCVCKPGYHFKKGLCVIGLDVSTTYLSCNNDNECLAKTRLMKCVNNSCVCNMGYHLEDVICVPGSVKLNFPCTFRLECGLNAYCATDKVCTCLNGMSSSNEFDCYTSSITTSMLFFQFYYQDTLKPPDDFDQIMLYTKNSYDQVLFKYSTTSLDFASYKSLEVEVFEYSTEKGRWLVQLQIGLSQAIKLTEIFFNGLIKVLISQKDILLATNLSSPDYIQNEFMNYFNGIYPARTTAIKEIGEYCNIDKDCIDQNSVCATNCTDLNCLNLVKICKCKSNHYRAINIRNNQIFCAYGKRLNSTCNANELLPCGYNMTCSQGICSCSSGFLAAGFSCVPQNFMLPNAGCSKINDCPPFAKCQKGLCICYSSYVLIDGLCKPRFNQIQNVSNESCLGQTYCGRNAECSKSLTCRCLNGFQVERPMNQSCDPICSC